MFVARRIDLQTSQPVLQEPILRREVLSGIIRGVQGLEEIQARADAILAAAEQQAAQYLQQAQAEFWERAEAFLQAWQAEREQDLQAQADQVDQVLQQALSQLLGEVPEPRRVAVLLDQLLRSQQRPVNGQLNCHPEQVQRVTDWLRGQPCEALWTVQADNQLAWDQLYLTTATGAFSLDWAAIEGVAG